MLDIETRAEMLMTISDLSKEAMGFRVRLDYASMTDEELEREYNAFYDIAQERWAQEKREKELAVQEWEGDLQKLIALGAKDRATAIRWDYAALVGSGGSGYYCYERNIPYTYEDEVRKARKG